MEIKKMTSLHFCPMVGLPSTNWVGQEVADYLGQKKQL